VSLFFQKMSNYQHIFYFYSVSTLLFLIPDLPSC